MRALLTPILILAVFIPLRLTSTSAPRTEANCARTHVGFTPLTQLRSGRYHGFQGDLYEHGSNTPPAAYAKLGLKHAKLVQPRNAAGAVDSKGRIGLLSIGMSNTSLEFRAFIKSLPAHINSHLSVVNGAISGQDAEIVANPKSRYWMHVEQLLSRAGVTDRQVQAVWLLEAIKLPTQAFPADARRLEKDLQAISRNLEARFPNLQLIYLSSRTYAGYATTRENPEPYAYESGFAVKWLLGDSIKAATMRIPWLAWGPYLWTDGTRGGRSDGLTWECDDVRSDGTHPSALGADKVAQLLVHFFTTKDTARTWFLPPMSS